jgi:glyoxylase-like metal-dependent hydrolase (beta-lactamase superfamily II)
MLVVGPAAAQDVEDVQAVLQAAADTMGVTDMMSIEYSGSGWIGRLGQNYAPEQDWPRFELAEYMRTIDFETNSSTERLVTRQGDYPARGGGAPIVGERRETRMVRGEHAWNAGIDRDVPMPQAAELRLLEIFLTPHGFLKGAMAGDPIAVTRNEYGQRVTVVSFIALDRYRINGTITEDNVIERVQTWLPNPIVGDLYYETVYTNYQDAGGGMMFPMNWHQHQDFDDGAHEPNVSGGDHTFQLSTIDDVEVNVADAALNVPDAARNAMVPPMRVEAEEVSEGVWLMAGGSHHSVAVEFDDHVAVIEAPLNEARSLAVIDEIMRRIPDKPIRWVVTTHHHWDHLGGMRAYVHEGATVVTHQGNFGYYQEVLRARPWLLEPDRFSLFPPEEWSEGYIFETLREKYILGDTTRLVELHHVQGLAHAAGMLIAYLPHEKILVQADLFTPPGPGGSLPASPNASARSLYSNVQRLGLDVETIVPIHGVPGPWSQFAEWMEAAQ